MQGTVQTVAFYRKRAVFGDVVLPRQGFYALKQFVKGSGGKTADHQQYPLAEAAADICLGQSQRIRLKIDPPVFRSDGPHIHVPQLVAHQSFQPEQAGAAKFKLQIGSSQSSSRKKSSK